MKRFLGLIIILLASVPRGYALEFVPIASLGNPANKYGYGCVDYLYEIGKYEVTNQEYCIFLNRVASEYDPYGLFSPLMQEHFMGGIIRTGTVGKYHYECKSGYDRRPVVGVTWMSAVRFVNWLHYNACNIESGLPVEQWGTETEGDAICGAYDTRNIPQCRNAHAVYWLPSRSEWEKAAYYDGTHWRITTLQKGANCFSPTDGWGCPYPHIARVGLSEGPNGTYDQQGNAAEWVEDSVRGGEWKYALGGSLIRPAKFAYCGELEGDDPNKSITSFGFRVCRLPDAVQRKSTVFCDLMRTNANAVREFAEDVQGTKYVLVSDAGNQGDPLNRFKGAVGYDFMMARTELTNAEYCAFLNAVAVAADPYRLYDPNMGESVCGGILRKETDEGFRYVCKSGWEYKPVVYIGYYDLARYANWMHYGTPRKGVSELGTTEGDERQGAYDTRDFERVRGGEKAPYERFGVRNEGARFWIPNEDEWFKAAYYDPMKLGNRKYHDYPTRTSDAPSRMQANYMIDNRLSVGAPFFVADVNAFPEAASYYGTLQQGGNVWEWIETWQYDVVGIRGLRGGSWSYTAYGLNACNTDPGGIDDRSYVFGGRLCMSADPAGWKPVRKPHLRSFYEFVQLLPLSRILLLAAVLFGSMAVIVLFVGYRFIFKRCRKY